MYNAYMYYVYIYDHVDVRSGVSHEGDSAVYVSLRFSGKPVVHMSIVQDPANPVPGVALHCASPLRSGIFTKLEGFMS